MGNGQWAIFRLAYSRNPPERHIADPVLRHPESTHLALLPSEPEGAEIGNREGIGKKRLEVEAAATAQGDGKHAVLPGHRVPDVELIAVVDARERIELSGRRGEAGDAIE